MNITTMTLLSIFAGSAIALQSTMSGQLGFLLKNPLWATYTVFLVSTVLMTVILCVIGLPIPSLITVKSVPRYLWFTGSLLSILALSVVYWQMPKIGVANVMSGVLAGQIILSILASHYGWFNLPVTPLNLQRVFGTGLLIVSVLLINGKAN